MASAANEGVAWPELHRARRAIVVVDVVESVRLMQDHEADVIDRWRRFVNEVRTEVLPKHGGRLVKSLGDGMLLEFGSVPEAVAAAPELQRRIGPYNERRAPPAAIWLRVGIHVAEVVLDELDVYGSGVNLAARLAGAATPGGIVVSADVRDDLMAGLDIDFVDMGECFFKNILNPVRAYEVHNVSADESSRPAPPQSLRPSLAVLSLAGDASQAPIGSLVADELAVQASAQGLVDVISRLSTRMPPAMLASPTALLEKLRASYGVSGSFTVLGSRLMLSVELVFAPSNHVVWSGTVQTTVDALVASPADVLHDSCQQIMAALEMNETRRAHSLPIASLHSYTLLIGGVSLMHRLGRRDFDRARELLDAVIERVPRHPDAYAWMAKWHILRAHQGWSDDPARSQAQARDVAHRALDRDDRCGLALTIAGMVKVYFERRLDEGEQLYRQALGVNPSDALAWLLKGTLHGFRGEGAQAVEDTRRASRLSPLDPMRYYYDALAASAAASAGLYDEAVELAQRSLRSNSMHASTLRVLAISHSMMGRVDLAKPIVERLLALEPSFTVTRFLERAPGAEFEIGKRFAQALAQAGVPA